MFLLNTLKTPDIIFFISLLVIVLLCVGIYFLIPVFKRQQFDEQRKNLYEREKIFQQGHKATEPESVEVVEDSNLETKTTETETPNK